jgi:hypothetical protein
VTDRPREFLERNVRIRIALIRDLAEGKLTQRKLAAKYDCSQPGIAQFKTRHLAEIEEMKANLEDKLAGLWIADKTKRIAAYQTSVEIADQEIARALDGRLTELQKVRTPDGDDVYEHEVIVDISDVIGRLERARHRALRSVAEERGELPSRIALHMEGAEKVEHVLKGVDMDKL